MRAAYSGVRGNRASWKICPPKLDKLHPASENPFVLGEAMDPMSTFAGVVAPATNTVENHVIYLYIYSLSLYQLSMLCYAMLSLTIYRCYAILSIDVILSIYL